MSGTAYNLWLLPVEPLRGKLRLIIDQLAAKYDAARFVPHVTFFSGQSDEQEITGIAQDLMDQPLPMELKPICLSHTHLFTKTLFVQFEDSQPLRDMYHRAVAVCSRPTGYKLNPHLSLLYKTMNENEKARLCRRLDIPAGPFLFDSFQAIEMETPFTAPEQIERCRTVYDSTKKR